MSKPNPSLTSRRGLFIGRYFRIEFYLHYSWFLIAAIVTYTLATEVFPHPQWYPGASKPVYLAMGFIAAAFFFLSIILHELGHSLVSQRCGIPVPRITLLFIGGLAEIAREPDDPKSELRIALGGPAVTVILVIIFQLCAWFFGWLAFGSARAICTWLAVTNLVLVIFNMIPGYPLDGGRVLRALLWARSGKLRQSTFITSRIGIGFSWLLIAWGVFALVYLHQWNAFVLFLIAIFLKGAAESGYAHALQREALTGVQVREIMTPSPMAIPDTLPLNMAVDDYFLANHHVAYPVSSADGDFRGLLRLENLREVPREKWPYTTAGDLVSSLGADALKIESTMPASRAMRSLLPRGQGRLAVVENGKLVGIITRRDIMHVVEIHNELEE